LCATLVRPLHSMFAGPASRAAAYTVSNRLE
jgi:hypothetical protein